VPSARRARKVIVPVKRASVLLLLLATLTGCAANASVGSTSTAARRRPAHRHTARHRIVAKRAPIGTALAALATLRIKGRAPLTGYTREQFGGGWATVNGCDERDRILARDLRNKRYEPGDDCAIESGVLTDPYTRERIVYTRGASEVDIDHVVALADAWQKGAQQWSAVRRETFANDPLELLAVSAHANRAKGDGDTATWLPPNKAFRCTYVERQIAVKRRYGIWVTQAEHDAMARVLGGCQGRQRPPAATTPPPSNTVRVFPNCAAVRAAGLAPLPRGTPEYNANQDLDGDHDGLACE
jgi:Protein of unknown function (DUF1524)/Excalibur calcium-binding domain